MPAIARHHGAALRHLMAAVTAILLVAAAAPGQPASASVLADAVEILPGAFRLTTPQAANPDRFISTPDPIRASVDGQTLVFGSDRIDLLPDVPSSLPIFLWNAATGLEQLTDPTGAPMGLKSVHLFEISGDASAVAVHSFESLGTYPDTGSHPDWFVIDRDTQTVHFLSTDKNGVPFPDGSGSVELSHDGDHALISSRHQMVADDTDNATDTVLIELSTGTRTLLPKPTSGTPFPQLPTSVSRHVLYTAPSGALHVHDRVAGTLSSRVDVDTAGQPLPGYGNRRAVLSDDGSTVAFSVDLQGDPLDTNGLQDVYVHDVTTGTTRWVSADGGAAAGGHSGRYWVELSPAGRYVLFSSAASLVDGRPDGLFMYDTVTDQLTQPAAHTRPHHKGMVHTFYDSWDDRYDHSVVTDDGSVAFMASPWPMDPDSPAITCSSGAQGCDHLYYFPGSDLTAPTVTGTPDRAPDHNGFYNGPVTVTWTATDDQSTVTSPPDTVVSGQGSAVQVTSDPVCDDAGNCATGTLTLAIDRTPPQVTTATSPAPNGHGWHRTPVTVTTTCTDAISGIDTCPAPVDLTTDGAAQQVTGTATDLAGNTTTATTTVHLDTTPPHVELVDAPADGSTIPDTDETAATCTATDATSGLDGDCAVTVQRTDAAPGSQAVTVTGTATDLAGNTTTATVSYTVVTDTDAPTVTYQLDRAANAAGWHDSPVTVTFTCTDPSGVPHCPDPYTFAIDGPSQTLHVTVADTWGNTATVLVAGINIDTVAPTVTFDNAEDTYWVADTIDITCSATDTTSGIAEADCPDVQGPAATYGPGQHTVTATATDHAGNTTTTSHTFTVQVTPGGIGDLLDDLTGGTGGSLVADLLQTGATGTAAVVVEGLCCTDQGGGIFAVLTRDQADLVLSLIGSL